MDYKIINEFLAKKFKEATNVLLFGSYTKSVKFSDIDILILTDSNLNFSKEVYTFNKQSFEVFVLSKNNIFEIIENDRANGIYISILKEGKIIKDEDSFLKNLKNLINTKQIYTSPFLKKNYIENKLRQTLCYMESVEDFYEKDFLLGEINSQLIDLRLVELGIIEAKKIKHKYEKIKYYDNEFLKDIINLKNDYLKSAFSYKNYVENLQMYFPIYNILNRPFYSNNYFLNDVYNDEIVIYIKTEESNFEILKTTFLLELKKNNINDFFFYKIQEHRVQEKGLYLVIFDSNKNIINNIIPIFNKLFSNNITFPYQLDISSLLGIFPKSEYKKCKPFLVELSSYLNENIISEDKIILLFLNVYIGSYIVSGLSKDYFVKRFELMLENFETLIGHKNHNVSLFQEEIYKKHLIGSVFKEKQIEGNILKIYGDAMDNWDVSCLPDDEINSVLKSLDFNIIYTNSFYVEYNFINMILNIFMINDFQKLYIFRTIAAFFK